MRGNFTEVKIVGYEDAIFCSRVGKDFLIGESLEIEIAQMNSVKTLRPQPTCDSNVNASINKKA